MADKLTSSNPCVRCGAERVVLKSWIEESERDGWISRLTHTLMVCPDAACQARVEKELQQKLNAHIERAKLHAAQDLLRQQRAKS